MTTDKDSQNRQRKAPAKPRREYEVAYFTKELGRPLQRKLLAQQLSEMSEGSAGAQHGDDASFEESSALPPHDRAG